MFQFHVRDILDEYKHQNLSFYLDASQNQAILQFYYQFLLKNYFADFL